MLWGYSNLLERRRGEYYGDFKPKDVYLCRRYCPSAAGRHNTLFSMCIQYCPGVGHVYNLVAMCERLTSRVRDYRRYTTWYVEQVHHSMRTQNGASENRMSIVEGKWSTCNCLPDPRIELGDSKQRGVTFRMERARKRVLTCIYLLPFFLMPSPTPPALIAGAPPNQVPTITIGWFSAVPHISVQLIRCKEVTSNGGLPPRHLAPGLVC